MQQPYGIRQLPAHWGRWFRAISDSTMKATNLNVFYQMGSTLGFLIDNCSTGQEIAELATYVIIPREWLIAFLEETRPVARYLPDSRVCAQELLNEFTATMTHGRITSGVAVTQYECSKIFDLKERFEKNFEQECKKLSVFTVTPKGTRDTGILIESPESDFTDRQIAVLPSQFIVDLKQAARCLAFDLPTACAFHVCRATESLIITYYELLAGHK